MIGILLAALLFTQTVNGEPSSDSWERYIFSRELNECMVRLFGEQARNGGITMDNTGHGTAADRVLEQCRKELGVGKEK